MDDKWFKQKQKLVGVTAEDIAREAGRTRSNVSHILNGHQKMSLHWAKAFAKVLNQPLDEVLRRAGVTDDDNQAKQPTVTGFGEGDATPFTGSAHKEIEFQEIARHFGGNKPGIDVWTVNSDALALRGYLPGDHILVDTHQSEMCRAGDTVVAQVYNRQAAHAETILRLLEPPVLVAATSNPATQLARVIDNDNVVIKGKVIASWRLT